MTLEERRAMLFQMRWVAAQRASGGRDDEATTALIRTHQAITAIDAAIAAGEPEQVWNVDVDGRPLDPNHAWNKTGQPYDLHKLIGS